MTCSATTAGAGAAAELEQTVSQTSLELVFRQEVAIVAGGGGDDGVVFGFSLLGVSVVG